MSESESARRESVVRELSKKGFDVLWCAGCWRIVRAKKRGFGLKCSALRRKQAHKETCLASAANTMARSAQLDRRTSSRFAADRHTPPNR